MKTKIVAIFALVLISLALAGAAYAVYTQASVTIGGTVNTGTLDVEITPASNGAYWSWTGGGSISSDAHSVTVTANNLYQGASFTISVPVENMGSLPATLTETSSTSADYTIVPSSWTGSLASLGTTTLVFKVIMSASVLPGTSDSISINVTATSP